MRQYTLLLVFSGLLPQQIKSSRGNKLIRRESFIQRKKEVLFFVKNIIVLLTSTLGGIVFSFVRLSYFAQHSEDRKVTKSLGGVDLARLYYKTNKTVTRQQKAFLKNKARHRTILENEPQYRFVFSICLHPSKINLIRHYLKDQHDLVSIHIFRS